MRDFYNIIAPFIAAFLASFLTYFFTVRTKKHEALIAQRLPAFKAIQKKLVEIQHYCEAKLGELQSNEFTPKVDELPPEENKSALEHLTELKRLVDDNIIFLSKSSNDAVNKIYSELAGLCFLELESQRCEDLYLGDGAYKIPLSQINESIQKLYNDLKLPK
jgi:hypothetical protein